MATAVKKCQHHHWRKHLHPDVHYIPVLYVKNCSEAHTAEARSGKWTNITMALTLTLILTQISSIRTLVHQLHSRWTYQHHQHSKVSSRVVNCPNVTPLLSGHSQVQTSLWKGNAMLSTTLTLVYLNSLEDTESQLFTFDPHMEEHFQSMDRKIEEPRTSEVSITIHITTEVFIWLQTEMSDRELQDYFDDDASQIANKVVDPDPYRVSFHDQSWG